MPLHYEAAVIYWTSCDLCSWVGQKVLDDGIATTLLGSHLSTEHPGWEKDMQKLRNGIDPAQKTIDQAPDKGEVK